MHPTVALRSLRPSGSYRLSPDAPRSRARCAAMAIRAVPGLLRLLSFIFAQDVADTDEGYIASCRIDKASRALGAGRTDRPDTEEDDDPSRRWPACPSSYLSDRGRRVHWPFTLQY